MHFLQVAVGYFVGRLLVSLIFIPAYYKGTLETAYDFLGKRFVLGLRKYTSTIFIVPGGNSDSGHTSIFVAALTMRRPPLPPTRPGGRARRP